MLHDGVAVHERAHRVELGRGARVDPRHDQSRRIGGIDPLRGEGLVGEVQVAVRRPVHGVLARARNRVEVELDLARKGHGPDRTRRLRDGVGDDLGVQRHVTSGPADEGVREVERPRDLRDEDVVPRPERLAGLNGSCALLEFLPRLIDEVELPRLRQLHRRVVDGDVRHVLEADADAVRIAGG